MNVLFTGASSFTGMWFVQELAKAGYNVTAALKSPIESYTGTRRQRIDRLAPFCEIAGAAPFGSESFLKLIQQKPWALFCHHAADVTNYKSSDFNPVAALANNTENLVNVLNLLKKQSCEKVLLTGSVFEPHEGAGSDNLRAVSPYGLSKGLTFEMFRYYCSVMEIQLAKFVIPNPFGPFEEFRFTSFLVQNWFEGKEVFVSMPSYVRDNIHVSLLAKSYAAFAKTKEPGPLVKINPSGYPESQGAFTSRFAQEMRSRLDLPCLFKLGEQTDFSEPKVRLNTDLIQGKKLGWCETQAWDELANYYQTLYQPVVR